MEIAIVAPILIVLGGLTLLAGAWVTFQYFVGGKSG
jgi:hypothetical protein